MKTVLMKNDMNEVHQYPHADSDSLLAEKIRDWTEYFDVKDFLKQYEKTSATEALINALELKQLVKKAKAKLVGFACIIDRSNKKSLRIKKKIVSQMKIEVPTYKKNKCIKP